MVQVVGDWSGIQSQVFLIPKPKFSPLDYPLPILIPMECPFQIQDKDSWRTYEINELKNQPLVSRHM